MLSITILDPGLKEAHKWFSDKYGSEYTDSEFLAGGLAVEEPIQLELPEVKTA
ncbi:MAG: hypothetical protein HYV76_00840 [Candidatus Vogelbacteria bacterium]|nr:hypothetical protein [Candidatus Vogelbacteria bacterium]